MLPRRRIRIFGAAGAFLMALLLTAYPGPARAQGDDAAAPPSRRAKHQSGIDRFLLGAVKFFGAQSLVSNDPAAGPDAGRPAVSAPAPNPSSLTKDPTEKPEPAERSGALEAPSEAAPSSPPPVQTSAPPSQTTQAGSPQGPLFQISPNTPGAQLLNPILDAPSMIATEQTAAGAINSISYASVVNGVGVLEGFTSVQNALGTVEGVTFQGVLNTGASFADTAWSGLTGSLQGGTLSNQTFSNVSVPNSLPIPSLPIPTSVPSFNLPLPSSFISSVPLPDALVALGSTFLGSSGSPGGSTPPPSSPPPSGPPLPPGGPTPPPGGSTPPPGGSTPPPGGVTTASYKLASAAPAASLAAAQAPLSGISALSSVESQISGQMVSRIPTLSGSPGLYFSRLAKQFGIKK